MPDLATPVRHPPGPVQRRTSNTMPSLPLATPPPGTNIPQHAGHHHAVPAPLSPVLHGRSSDSSAVPMRHPRPLTPAEMCAEVEKEGEGVVNRLTRELTALRAITSSRASNASISSTSTTTSAVPTPSTTSFLEPYPGDPSFFLVGGTGHSVAMDARERSSSSASAREQLAGTGTGERTRDLPLRSPSASISGGRIAETAAARAEMETVKAENEGLRRRVRELERLVRAKREEGEDRRGRASG